MNDAFYITKGELQQRILSNLLYFAEQELE